MKHTFITLTVLISMSLNTTSLFAQKILWEKSYGGKHADYLMDIQPTADYGFIVAGSSISGKNGTKEIENKGNFDYWIWKMNENGDLEWQKSFGGSGSDFLQCFKNTNDGGFILAGTSNSSNDNSYKNDKKSNCRGADDFWIIKLNAKGEEEWQKTIGGNGQEKLKSISLTSDGGYIIGGSSNSNKSNEKQEDSFGGMDYWVIKLDSKGTIEWQRTIGGIYNDELQEIEQTTDKGYIIGGISNSPVSGNKSTENLGYNDYWVLKLDTKGNIVWQKTFGGKLEDSLVTIHKTLDNKYIIGGYTNSESTKSKSNKNENGTDFWILKIDEEGKIIWQEKYNIGNHDILSSIIENKDHSFLLGGYTQSEMPNNAGREENGINDYVAIKISENGEELWRKTVGSKGEDVLKKVIETRDGGYILAGTSNASRSNNLPIIEKSDSGKISDKKQSDKIIKNDIADRYNETKSEIGDFSEKLKNSIDSNKPSPVKTSLPENGIGNNRPNEAAKENQQPLPSSKDKKTSFGSNDFWIVKLKDNDKTPVNKVAIEAFPNPATNFTNIIVGYEFESGTATLVDLSGRILQSFTIKERTVPLDLQNLPDGIYVVNIKTNKQSDGIKIIKGSIKN